MASANVSRNRPNTKIPAHIDTPAYATIRNASEAFGRRPKKKMSWYDTMNGVIGFTRSIARSGREEIPEISFSSVDFPEPLRPMMPNASPRSMVKETFFRAGTDVSGENLMSRRRSALLSVANCDRLPHS